MGILKERGMKLATGMPFCIVDRINFRYSSRLLSEKLLVDDQKKLAFTGIHIN
jgi:hypothetical protein